MDLIKYNGLIDFTTKNLYFSALNTSYKPDLMDDCACFKLI